MNSVKALLLTQSSAFLQATFLQFGTEIVARGYAVIVYEGPGQGQVIRNEPYMPFYAGDTTLAPHSQFRCGILSWSPYGSI